MFSNTSYTKNYIFKSVVITEGPTPTPKRAKLFPREGTTADPNPKKEGPTPISSPRRANPHPEKEVQPLPKKSNPREGRANPNPKGRPHPKKEEPTPTLRRANLYPRERRANPKPEEGRANPNPNGRPQTQGPIPVLRHCVILIKNKYYNHTKLDNRNPKEGQPRPQASFTLGSGLSPHLPFLLAGPLAFPFRPSWLDLASPSFGSGPGQPRPEGPTPTPRRKGQPSPRKKRPTSTQEKEGPTPTQEKEGPNKPREGRANPLHKSGKDIFVIYYITILIMSLPILPKGVGSGLTLPLLLGQASPSGSGLAPPLPFLLAGPLAFPFSPFWLALSLGAWPTPTRKGRANLHPRKKADPYPREGRANPTRRADPKTGKGRSNSHSENCQHLPKEEGPTSTPRKKGQNPQPEREKPKRKKTTHMKNRKN